MLHTTPDGVKIQCIVVAQVDSRYLAAFPFPVWHRMVSKRILDRSLLSRPALVEVGYCSLEDASGRGGRRLHEDLDGLRHGGVLLDAGYCGRRRDLRPSVQCGGLWRCAPLSPVSGGSFAGALRLSQCGKHWGKQGPAGPGKRIWLCRLGARVSALETTLTSMSESLDKLTEHLGRKAAKKVHIDARPVQMEDPLSRAAAKFLGLDPSVVSAAINAGVSEENLTEMQRMLAKDPLGGKKLREPALRKTVKPTPKLQSASTAAILSESEDESEGDSPGCGSEGNSSPAAATSTLDKLTEILSLLSQDKLKKAKSSKIDLALDSVGGASSTDAGAGSTLKRASAARRALRTALQDSPDEISAVIEKLMLEDLMMQTTAPGMPKASLNARAWLEHRSRIGAYKTSAFCSWSAAGILDDLVQGRMAHARARAGLLVLMLDQCAIDKGSWALAAELSLEQAPPLATLANHSLPSISDGESPFSRLLDPLWAEVMLAHLKDAEDYVQKRRNLGWKNLEDNSADSPKPKPKSKAKAKAAAESSVSG